jgi:hypothetical protein
MKYVSKADLPKVQEELKKKAAEDPKESQVLRILTEKVENFDKYTGILDELKQVKAVVEQRQAQQPLNPGSPALPTGAMAPAGSLPPGVSTLIEFIRPFISQYLAPKDPMADLIMESMRKSITLQDTITQAVINRLLPPGVEEATTKVAEHVATVASGHP